jgi:hypothetical protein
MRIMKHEHHATANMCASTLAKSLTQQSNNKQQVYCII